MSQGSSGASPLPGSAPGEIRADPGALVSLAHTLCEAGRIHEAKQVSRLVLRDHPQLAVAHAALGRALYELGRLDEAEARLERTIVQTPGCFAAHRWLAEVLIQKGAWDRAQAVLQQAAVLSPDNPRIEQLLQSLPRGPSQGPPMPEPADPHRPIPELAAEIEVARPRPRTEEYPAARFDEAPANGDQSDPGVDQRDVLTSRELEGLRTSLRRRWRQRLTLRVTAFFHNRVLPFFDRQDWRALGLAAVVGLGLALAFAIGCWSISTFSRRSEPRSKPAPIPSITSPTPTADAVDKARTTLERAIASGELGALLDGSQTAIGYLGAPSVASAQVFATALLATEYGLPVPEETRALLAKLQKSAPTGTLASELAASRILLATRGGDLTAAPPGERLAETSWLTFAQAKARRLAGVGPIDGVTRAIDTSAPALFGPAVILRAESLLDAGEPNRARDLVAALVQQTPGHARAQVAFAEVSAALARTPSPEEAAALRTACSTDGPRSPIVDAGCQLLSAQELRRKGQRNAARQQALQIAAVAPSAPRVLGQLAQLLANLGETRRAEDLVARARTLSSAAFAPVTWSIFAVRLNHGEEVIIDQDVPANPESRLIAVRAALARGGAAGVQRVLQAITPEQVDSDQDLSWFAVLPRIEQKRAAARVASRYATAGKEPPGPVGSYVLGLLARWGGRGQLAADWLSQARDGHGDACSATTLYAAALTDLGQAPRPGTAPTDCARPK